MRGVAGAPRDSGEENVPHIAQPRDAQTPMFWHVGQSRLRNLSMAAQAGPVGLSALMAVMAALTFAVALIAAH